MLEHVIYYFSGTGNSLKAALSIQKALGSCDLIPMNATPHALPKLKSIGFVFPCYFGGVPNRVQEFISELDFSAQELTYVYAVITYGAACGAALSQFEKLVGAQGAHLSYAASVKAFSNYVVLYDMSDKVAEKTAQTKEDLLAIIADIAEQKSSDVKKASPLALAYNRMSNKVVAQEDQHFVVRDSCNGCGVCERVCPVDNVYLEEGIPRWRGHCEQCLACLQWCPKRAIDYGEKTRKRGRYTHPEITSKMFIAYLDGAGITSKDNTPSS